MRGAWVDGAGRREVQVLSDPQVIGVLLSPECCYPAATQAFMTGGRRAGPYALTGRATKLSKCRYNCNGQDLQD